VTWFYELVYQRHVAVGLTLCVQAFNSKGHNKQFSSSCLVSSAVAGSGRQRALFALLSLPTAGRGGRRSLHFTVMDESPPERLKEEEEEEEEEGL